MGAGGSLVSRRELLPAPEVLTVKGPIQGRRLQFKDGPTADIFLGIPYAKPPTGALRFKRPEPPDPWTRVLSCRAFCRRAIQITPSWEPLVARLPACSEDCLYLNVFAPKIEAGKKYPVFFFIHGGGLLMECPQRIPPEGLCRQLVAQGIVVVTMAYRLGFLGFFSTGDDACPGNMGHLDQVAALKWTAENIDRFGGDPKKITVGGQSAGGSSADLLSISPLSRDLIHQKVLLGGNSFGFWASSRLENTVSHCRDMAKELGWQPSGTYSSTMDENKAMMDFLRTLPAKKFGCTFFGYKPLFKKIQLPLTAVLDDYFLPKPIPKLREDAPQMPVICGVGEYEGLLFIGISTMGTSKKSLRNLLRHYARDEEHLKNGVEEIIEVYKKDGVPPKMHQLFPVVYGDTASNFALNLQMDYYRKRAIPCYSYIWEYTAKRRYGVVGLRFPFHGGTHGSELPYILRQEAFYSKYPYSKKEKQLCRIASDYFSAFIKHGNPNTHGYELHPHWPSITEEKEMQMICLKPNPTLRTSTDYFGKRLETIWPHIKIFWNDDGFDGPRETAGKEMNNNDEKSRGLDEKPDKDDEKKVDLELANALPRVLPPKGHSKLPAVE